MLRFETEGPKATLIIDDPDRRNPLTTAVIDGMIEAFRDLRGRPEIRAVVVTGAGDRAFSAGGDLAGGFFDEPIALHRSRGGLAELFREMRRSDRPVVARVNGHALAGGFGLMLACDTAIAVDHATFGMPEIVVGLWPMMITAVVRRALPQKAAFELMMSGRRIEAAEALALGAVGRVVPAADLDRAVDEFVDAIAAKSPAVLELGKHAFYATEDLPFDAALDHLQGGLTAVTLTEDAREGVDAFVGKRTPRFTGR